MPRLSILLSSSLCDIPTHITSSAVPIPDPAFAPPLFLFSSYAHPILCLFCLPFLTFCHFWLVFSSVSSLYLTLSCSIPLPLLSPFQSLFPSFTVFYLTLIISFALPLSNPLPFIPHFSSFLFLFSPCRTCGCSGWICWSTQAIENIGTASYTTKRRNWCQRSG